MCQGHILSSWLVPIDINLDNLAEVLIGNSFPLGLLFSSSSKCPQKDITVHSTLKEWELHCPSWREEHFCRLHGILLCGNLFSSIHYSFTQSVHHCFISRTQLFCILGYNSALLYLLCCSNFPALGVLHWSPCLQDIPSIIVCVRGWR